mmetsp:Transcript_30933/g.45309  ORF Transcript_30933/g.45309 Transcript_30933/m.45309 type:complete len:142 (-) Transcript_30933:223-648(-)|eukprot:CAMPEP_0116017146 /NCGR_PEP_ID=MMETSP0321-20121206/7880_1 /TAXON_ID=163516 /ORGANISM="Leptocylindrus danicus var. danicus, Strain B650" /LENGTH=141 /DNA_ID=CAMNT_0003487295 /DNA_START=726 /DNA_END=1151 /DNA_ORIENTATION=-
MFAYKHIFPLLLVLMTGLICAQKAYPEHWGEPPKMETMDLRTLPAGFGEGSGTRFNWIVDHMKADVSARHPNRIVNQKGPWPEFVGLEGKFVKEFLFQDIGMGDIIILNQGTPVTRDYRPNRVRIFVDPSSGEVVNIPNRG